MEMVGLNLKTYKNIWVYHSTAQGFSLLIQNAQNPLLEIEDKLEQRSNIPKSV